MASVSPELPSSLRSLARSLRLGFRAEPLLIVVALVTTLAAAAPDALFALGLAMLVDAASAGDDGRILFAALCLGALAAGTWVLRALGDRANRRFADRAAVPIEAHVATLQASVATIEHHERPEYMGRLSLLRDHADTLSELYRSLFDTLGALLRLLITLALLVSVHPVLGLLGLFAVPTIFTSNWRAAVEKRAEEAGAQDERRARHLFLLGTTAAPGKEIRVARVRQRLSDAWNDSWCRRHRPMARTRWATAAWQGAAMTVFAIAFVAAVAYVWSSPGSSPGELVLVLAAGSRLSHYIGQTMSETHFLRAIWLDGSRRLAWLEDFARAHEQTAEQPAPDRLRRGIRFENVSFRYPGTDALVLDDVTLTLPAGKVVAIVGENGAGKSTLVKLIARFYDPTCGRILVDDADLIRICARSWRDRLTGAFQDFFRFEYPVQRSVGLGNLARMEEPAAVAAAVSRAGADDVVSKLDQGLDTQLGVTWTDGVELSHGQWQKVALARGFMREEPLVQLLDEPTSALDAETEHALFERYAAAARAVDDAHSGRITVLVSHRFSTVRMADLIVVLDGARVVEHGTHDALIARGGRYAELYDLQASSYR